MQEFVLQRSRLARIVLLAMHGLALLVCLNSALSLFSKMGVVPVLLVSAFFYFTRLDPWRLIKPFGDRLWLLQGHDDSPVIAELQQIVLLTRCLIVVRLQTNTFKKITLIIWSDSLPSNSARRLRGLLYQ